MNDLSHFSLRAWFAPILLLCFSASAGADEIQDISKLFKQGQYTQALERVNSYLTGSPKDAQARFLKGLILTEQGKTSEAIGLFSALTEDYPELPEPYNNLAVLYASQGQYDKARVSLDMAIRTHPSYATAHENLGDIYAKMASQAYDRALQLDGSNPSTQTKLALIKDLFVTGNKSSKPAPSTASSMASAPKPLPAVPAATPVPKKAVAAPNNDKQNEIMQTVRDWADAWSSQDVDRYLAFYAADFKTPGGESRNEWEAMRRERVSNPQSIQVGVSNTRVNFSDDNHATVTFLQSYRASHLRVTSRKTLALVNTNSRWLIQEERSGK